MGTVTANRENYSVQEDITSFDPASPSGGVGQLSYSIRDYPGAHRLLNEVVTLDDPGRGRFEGIVRSLTRSDFSLEVVVDGALSGLNQWHTVAPYTGTLAGYLNYLANITGLVNPLAVDPNIATSTVVVTGYQGNVWDQLRSFLSANQWEVAQVYSRVVVRPMRKVVTIDQNIISENETANVQTPAPKFDVNWYEGEWNNSAEFYPVRDSDNPPLVVDANATLIQEFSVEGSLATINQPVVQDYVFNQSYAGSNGVYSVSGNDGLPITAAQWTARGGSLSARITEDPRVIEVTIRGADIADLSPFRIAMSAGTSNTYNSLHITGSGVASVKHTLTYITGESRVNSDTETGTEIDNPFIRTKGQALTAALYAMKALAGPLHTLSGSTVSLNQDANSAEDLSATMADFNASHPGMTMAQFNTYYDDLTMAQFNTIWEENNDSQFSHQLFGLGIGARINRDTCIYRVTSTTTGPDVVNYEAISDTTMGDFNSRFSGATMGDFNDHYTGQRMQDYNVTPLRPVTALSAAGYPGLDIFPATNIFPN